MKERYMMRAALGLLAATHVGCDLYEPASCSLACMTSCPGSMKCQEGLCVRREFTGTCASADEDDGAGSGGGVNGDGTTPPASSGAEATGGLLDPFITDDPVPPEVLTASCAGNGLEISPCPLPPPCRGVAYDLQLSVAGGVGPYTWQASEAAGVELSSEGRVTGVPSGSGELKVTVRDTKNTSAELLLSFSPRESCWFAYIGSEGSPQTALELFDPLLGDGVTPGPLSLPRDLPEGDRVVDFQFSPDGRLLALQVMSAGGVNRLRIFDAPDWREREIGTAVPGSVIGYGWKADSSALAVTSSAGETEYLAVVRMPAVRQVGDNVTRPAIVELSERVDSAPLWFGNDRVVLRGPLTDAPGTSLVYGTKFFADSFEPLSALGAYDTDGLRLRAGHDGFFTLVQFMQFPAAVEFMYEVDGVVDFTTHSSDVTPEPALGFVARVAASNELQIIRASEGQLSQDGLGLRPSAIAPGCDFLLAWSGDSKRLACLTGGEVTGTIRVFDFDRDVPSLWSTGIVEGDYSYEQNSALGRRRAFSPRGRWFAFSTGSALFLADLNGPRYVVRDPARVMPAGNDFDELSFSPDERRLLRHKGTALALYSLDSQLDVSSVFRQPPVSQDPPESSQCSEVGSADNWCGYSRTTAEIAWSADSKAAAFRATTPSGIQRSNVGNQQDPAWVIACGTAVASYAFQP